MSSFDDAGGGGGGASLLLPPDHPHEGAPGGQHLQQPPLTPPKHQLEEKAAFGVVYRPDPLTPAHLRLKEFDPFEINWKILPVDVSSPWGILLRELTEDVSTYGDIAAGIQLHMVKNDPKSLQSVLFAKLPKNLRKEKLQNSYMECLCFRNFILQFLAKRNAETTSSDASSSKPGAPPIKIDLPALEKLRFHDLLTTVSSPLFDESNSQLFDEILRAWAFLDSWDGLCDETVTKVCFPDVVTSEVVVEGLGELGGEQMLKAAPEWDRETAIKFDWLTKARVTEAPWVLAQLEKADFEKLSERKKEQFWHKSLLPYFPFWAWYVNSAEHHDFCFHHDFCLEYPHLDQLFPFPVQSDFSSSADDSSAESLFLHVASEFFKAGADADPRYACGIVFPEHMMGESEFSQFDSMPLSLINADEKNGLFNQLSQKLCRDKQSQLSQNDAQMSQVNAFSQQQQQLSQQILSQFQLSMSQLSQALSSSAADSSLSADSSQLLMKNPGSQNSWKYVNSRKVKQYLRAKYNVMNKNKEKEQQGEQPKLSNLEREFRTTAAPARQVLNMDMDMEVDADDEVVEKLDKDHNGDGEMGVPDAGSQLPSQLPSSLDVGDALMLQIDSPVESPHEEVQKVDENSCEQQQQVDALPEKEEQQQLKNPAPAAQDEVRKKSSEAEQAGKIGEDDEEAVPNKKMKTNADVGEQDEKKEDLQSHLVDEHGQRIILPRKNGKELHHDHKPNKNNNNDDGEQVQGEGQLYVDDDEEGTISSHNVSGFTDVLNASFCDNRSMRSLAFSDARSMRSLVNRTKSKKGNKGNGEDSGPGKPEKLTADLLEKMERAAAAEEGEKKEDGVKVAAGVDVDVGDAVVKKAEVEAPKGAEAANADASLEEDVEMKDVQEQELQAAEGANKKSARHVHEPSAAGAPQGVLSTVEAAVLPDASPKSSNVAVSSIQSSSSINGFVDLNLSFNSGGGQQSAVEGELRVHEIQNKTAMPPPAMQPKPKRRPLLSNRGGGGLKKVVGGGGAGGGFPAATEAAPCHGPEKPEKLSSALFQVASKSAVAASATPAAGAGTQQSSLGQENHSSLGIGINKEKMLNSSADMSMMSKNEDALLLSQLSSMKFSAPEVADLDHAPVAGMQFVPADRVILPGVGGGFGTAASQLMKNNEEKNSMSMSLQEPQASSLHPSAPMTMEIDLDHVTQKSDLKLNPDLGAAAGRVGMEKQLPHEGEVVQPDVVMADLQFETSRHVVDKDLEVVEENKSNQLLPVEPAALHGVGVIQKSVNSDASLLSAIQDVESGKRFSENFPDQVLESGSQLDAALGLFVADGEKESSVAGAPASTTAAVVPAPAAASIAGEDLPDQGKEEQQATSKTKKASTGAANNAPKAKAAGKSGKMKSKKEKETLLPPESSPATKELGEFFNAPTPARGVEGLEGGMEVLEKTAAPPVPMEQQPAVPAEVLAVGEAEGGGKSTVATGASAVATGAKMKRGGGGGRMKKKGLAASSCLADDDDVEMKDAEMKDAEMKDVSSSSCWAEGRSRKTDQSAAIVPLPGATKMKAMKKRAAVFAPEDEPDVDEKEKENNPSASTPSVQPGGEESPEEVVPATATTGTVGGKSRNGRGRGFKKLRKIEGDALGTEVEKKKKFTPEQRAQLLMDGFLKSTDHRLSPIPEASQESGEGPCSESKIVFPENCIQIPNPNFSASASAVNTSTRGRSAPQQKLRRPLTTTPVSSNAALPSASASSSSSSGLLNPGGQQPHVPGSFLAALYAPPSNPAFLEVKHKIGVQNWLAEKPRTIDDVLVLRPELKPHRGFMEKWWEWRKTEYREKKKKEEEIALLEKKLDDFKEKLAERLRRRKERRERQKKAKQAGGKFDARAEAADEAAEGKGVPDTYSDLSSSDGEEELEKAEQVLDFAPEVVGPCKIGHVGLEDGTRKLSVVGGTYVHPVGDRERLFNPLTGRDLSPTTREFCVRQMLALDHVSRQRKRELKVIEKWEKEFELEDKLNAIRKELYKTTNNRSLGIYRGSDHKMLDHGQNKACCEKFVFDQDRYVGTTFFKPEFVFGRENGTVCLDENNLRVNEEINTREDWDSHRHRIRKVQIINHFHTLQNDENLVAAYKEDWCTDHHSVLCLKTDRRLYMFYPEWRVVGEEVMSTTSSGEGEQQLQQQQALGGVVAEPETEKKPTPVYGWQLIKKTFTTDCFPFKDANGNRLQGFGLGEKQDARFISTLARGGKPFGKVGNFTDAQLQHFRGKLFPGGKKLTDKFQKHQCDHCGKDHGWEGMPMLLCDNCLHPYHLGCAYLMERKYLEDRVLKEKIEDCEEYRIDGEKIKTYEDQRALYEQDVAWAVGLSCSPGDPKNPEKKSVPLADPEEEKKRRRILKRRNQVIEDFAKINLLTFGYEPNFPGPKYRLRSFRHVEEERDVYDRCTLESLEKAKTGRKWICPCCMENPQLLSQTFPNAKFPKRMKHTVGSVVYVKRPAGEESNWPRLCPAIVTEIDLGKTDSGLCWGVEEDEEQREGELLKIGKIYNVRYIFFETKHTCGKSFAGDQPVVQWGTDTEQAPAENLQRTWTEWFPTTEWVEEKQILSYVRGSGEARKEAPETVKTLPDDVCRKVYMEALDIAAKVWLKTSTFESTNKLSLEPDMP